MNERNKEKLLEIDENLYFLPDSKGFYTEVNGDYERCDLTSDKKSIDAKLRNKLLRKYRKKIIDEHSKKYGD